MYRVNVLGTLKVIHAFPSAMRTRGSGTVPNLTFTAGLVAHEGGAGNNEEKIKQHAPNKALKVNFV